MHGQFESRSGYFCLGALLKPCLFGNLIGERSIHGEQQQTAFRPFAFSAVCSGEIEHARRVGGGCGSI
jgi:hypothetical protein